MKNHVCRRKLSAVYRFSALRVCCAVLCCAVCTVVQAEERKRLYKPICTYPEQRAEENRRVTKLSTMAKDWRWMYRRIPQVDYWFNRKTWWHDLLPNKDIHWAYLHTHRFGQEETAECSAGCGVPEDGEDVFFQCPKFQEVKAAINDSLKTLLTPDTLVTWLRFSNTKAT